MGECNLFTFRTNHLLQIDGPNLYYVAVFRFSVYDEMARNSQTLTKLKTFLLSKLFGVHSVPTTLVTVRYTGGINVLNTHDPNSSKSIIDLDPDEGPYHPNSGPSLLDSCNSHTRWGGLCEA